jgi:hypothetical protein
MNSISDSVNQAIEEATSSYGSRPLTDAANRHVVLSGLSAPDLVHQATDVPAPPAILDGLWLAVIDSYRFGPRNFWGAVVLKMVAPTLLHKVRTLRYERDLSEDVDQHLLSGVLHAAATAKLPDPARWTPHRLATRAVTQTRRWLAAEARSRCLSLDDLHERATGPSAVPHSDSGDLASLLALSRPAGVSDATAVLLYRNRVLGEPLASIANQLGMTGDELRMRRVRAEARLRRQLAA